MSPLATTQVPPAPDRPCEPGFARLLDPRQARDLLQRHLPPYQGGERTIADCRIGHVYYKRYLTPASWPKNRLAVCYHLTVDDREEQILHTRTYLGGRSHTQVSALGEGPQARPGCGAKVVHCPSLDMIAWAFPNDPCLPHLPAMADPRRVARHLPVALADGVVEGLAVAHYRPEERCLTRYRVRRDGRAVDVYGKCFADPDTATVLHHRIDHLWQASRDDSLAFAVARPLGCAPAVHTVWQEAVSGEGLETLVFDPAFPDYLKRVATGLARLHGGDLPATRRITRADHLAESRKKAAKLTQAFPRLAPTLDDLLDRIMAEAAVTAAPARPIHNDFHLRQLLHRDGRIVLFDLDEAALGDPLQDVADLLVDLCLEGTSAATRGLFVEAYESAAGCRVAIDDLAWHLRVKWLTKAYRAWVKQLPGHGETIEHCLTRAVEGGL